MRKRREGKSPARWEIQLLTFTSCVIFQHLCKSPLQFYIIYLASLIITCYLPSNSLSIAFKWLYENICQHLVIIQICIAWPLLPPYPLSPTQPQAFHFMSHCPQRCRTPPLSCTTAHLCHSILSDAVNSSSPRLPTYLATPSFHAGRWITAWSGTWWAFKAPRDADTPPFFSSVCHLRVLSTTKVVAKVPKPFAEHVHSRCTVLAVMSWHVSKIVWSQFLVPLVLFPPDASWSCESSCDTKTIISSITAVASTQYLKEAIKQRANWAALLGFRIHKKVWANWTF